MVQIECFNSEYSLNNWLREHTQYCIRDIKPIVGDNYRLCKFMVIYEDNTIEITAEQWESFKTAPIQPLPHYATTSLEKPYNDDCSVIYSNG